MSGGRTYDFDLIIWKSVESYREVSEVLVFSNESLQSVRLHCQVY
jgi:hypothetical protein